MALNTKAIKRRIRSIGNTKKITKAMEMISAVKMRRAVANALATRSYAALAWDIVNDIAKKTDINLHPLLAQRPVKKIGIIFITSNRGLAGGFTGRLIQAARQYIKSNEQLPLADAQIDVILTGRHGRKSIHKLGRTVVAEFEKIDLTTRIEEVFPLTELAISEYTMGAYDRIVVAYTDFVSAISQTPKIKQILPLERGIGGEPGFESAGESKKEKGPAEAGKYLFEPGTQKVLDSILPRLVEMQIYQAILESDASEHSARMLAMRNASDAAKEMIKELNNTFNKARQAAITQEISEIVGGAAALG